MSLNPGETLRAAREAQGLEIEAVAQRLRLMTRQIEAIESGDFASLGQPVFARGFVRNYARLLGVDPEPLVAALQGEPAESPTPAAEPEATEEPGVASRLGWLGSPWFLVSTLVVLLLIALPLGLYVWLNSDSGEARLAEHPAVITTRPDVPAVPQANPAASVAPQAAAETPPAATAVPVEEEAAPPEHTLELTFLGDAWVEIRDSSGRFVHRQLDRAGSKVVVDGAPPFDLVIGNAKEVRLSHNGRPLDLSPFIDITVARFTLEQ